MTESAGVEFYRDDFPIADLHPDSLNPRKTFDEADLKDLAASFGNGIGIIEPIVARVVDGQYRIVAGERRWRAAQLVGMTTAPVKVRALTDTAALKIMVVENDRRKDLNAFERAHGYTELMKRDPACADRKGLAKELGLSLSTVHAVLKMLDLIPAAQKALGAGGIQESHALEIARLSAADQARALSACNLHHPAGKALLSVRDLRTWIAAEVHTDLNAAPWKKDDATLLVAAGACTACPKREGEKTCTDRSCYELKARAYLERRLAQLTESPAAPAVVVTRAHYLSGDIQQRIPRKVLLASEYSELEPTDPSCGFTRAAVVVNAYGAISDELRRVCISRACPVHFSAAKSASRSSSKASASQADLRWRAAQKQKEHKRALDAAGRREVLAAINDKLVTLAPEALPDVDLRGVAAELFNHLHIAERKSIGPLMGWSDEPREQNVERAPFSDVLRFLVLVALEPSAAAGSEHFQPDAKPLWAAATRWKVDAPAIVKAVLAGGTRHSLRPTPKTLALDKAGIEAFGAVVSCDRFDAKKVVVKSLEYEGLLYTATGSAGTGRGGYERVEARRLHPRAAWPFKKIHPRAWSAAGGYGGLLVFTRGELYVTDPIETVVTPAKPPAQTSAQPKKPKNGSAKKR